MKEDKTFVVLCTEPFTSNHVAICSVAMVKVINSVIVQEFYSLIRPVAGKRNVLDALLSVFNGKKSANAPEFPEVLRLMEMFVGDSTIVAYEEEEEIGRLHGVCKSFGMEGSSLWKHEFLGIYHTKGERLEKSCEYNGIKLKADCSLLDKARACAELFMKVGQMHTVPLHECCDRLEFLSNGKKDLYGLLPDEELTNRNTIFYHQHIFTSGIFSDTRILMYCFPNYRSSEPLICLHFPRRPA